MVQEQTAASAATKRSLFTRPFGLLCLAMPAVPAFLPLYARSIGVENIGMFYVLVGVASIIIRPVK